MNENERFAAGSPKIDPPAASNDDTSRLQDVAHPPIALPSRSALAGMVTTTRVLFLATCAIALCTAKISCMSAENAEMRIVVKKQGDDLEEANKTVDKLLRDVDGMKQQWDGQKKANRWILDDINKLDGLILDQEKEHRDLRWKVQAQGDKIPRPFVSNIMRKEFENAQDLLFKHPEKTVDECNAIIVFVPFHYYAWELKGDALRKLRKDKDAMRAYRDGLEQLDISERAAKKEIGWEVSVAEMRIVRERMLAKIARLEKDDE